MPCTTTVEPCSSDDGASVRVQPHTCWHARTGRRTPGDARGFEVKLGGLRFSVRGPGNPDAPVQQILLLLASLLSRSDRLRLVPPPLLTARHFPDGQQLPSSHRASPGTVPACAGGCGVSTVDAETCVHVECAHVRASARTNKCKRAMARDIRTQLSISRMREKAGV